MPVPKKQDTTPHNPAVTPVSPEPGVLEPENFQSYLREEIRQATRLVMEEIMREEFTQFVGETGERSHQIAKGIATVSTRAI